MAFHSSGTRITAVPGANSAPGLVIIHDSTVTSANINTTYFVRTTALPATGDVEEQESRRKRYEAIVGQVQAGRGRGQDTAGTTIGAALIAIGNNDPVLKRLAVDDDDNGGTIKVV